MSSRQIYDHPELLEDGTPLVDLTKATKKIPTNPSRATAERWVRTGVRGTRLKTVMVGGRRFTTENAIREFLVSQQYTEPEHARTEPKRSTKSQRDIEAAARRFGLPEPQGSGKVDSNREGKN